MRIRHIEESDWPATWRIIKPEFRAGETYALPTDFLEVEAHRVWVELPLATFVAVDDNEIVGTYYLKANQLGPGSHVCNCGYIVSGKARGKGIASAMCLRPDVEPGSPSFESPNRTPRHRPLPKVRLAGTATTSESQPINWTTRQDGRVLPSSAWNATR